MLAGISSDYYLRLEQGRDRNPTIQVLEALARVLQLDQAATDYLLGLAAPRPRQRRRRPKRESAPGGIRQLLDVVGLPAFVEGRYFDVLAANRLAYALSPSLQAGRNRLRSVFLDPAEKAFYPDWDQATAGLVAGFRRSVGSDVDDPGFVQLVGELSLLSERFRRLWARHYDLFKVVNRRLALLDVFFTLVATSVEAAGLLSRFTPLVLLGSSRYASALPPAQLHALAYLPGDLSAIDYSIYTVFFGFDILCVAYLVLRSTFLPRAIGVLLAIDGLACLAYGFADLLAPGFAAHLIPWIELPAVFGEGSLCLWLLVAGVDVGRWQERASATIRMRSTQVEELA